MTQRVLVLFAHPRLEISRANARLLEELQGLEGVTLRDLYELYPSFDIDPKVEQQVLSQHDVIVLHHPLYWYSCPALLKEWLDVVLEVGWAYGPGGRALAGKVMLNAVTTGGRAEAYTPAGHNRHTLRELLAPFEATARFCGMAWLPPYAVHGALRVHREGQMEPFARTYRCLLEALRDGSLDLARAAQAEHLNALVCAQQQNEVPA
jgi:glutathione-regulated potassium-efflux system ancillary protein KefG